MRRAARARATPGRVIPAADAMDFHAAIQRVPSVGTARQGVGQNPFRKGLDAANRRAMMRSGGGKWEKVGIKGEPEPLRNNNEARGGEPDAPLLMNATPAEVQQPGCSPASSDMRSTRRGGLPSPSGFARSWQGEPR